VIAAAEQVGANVRIYTDTAHTTAIILVNKTVAQLDPNDFLLFA